MVREDRVENLTTRLKDPVIRTPDEPEARSPSPHRGYVRPTSGDTMGGGGVRGAPGKKQPRTEPPTFYVDTGDHDIKTNTGDLLEGTKEAITCREPRLGAPTSVLQASVCFLGRSSRNSDEVL